MSQAGLADQIGVTFQQVQKYERGTNRISASRMQQIAIALGVSVGSLFGSDEVAGWTNSAVFGPRDTVMSKADINLNKAFMKIRKAAVRKAIIELVVSLGGS